MRVENERKHQHGNTEARNPAETRNPVKGSGAARGQRGLTLPMTALFLVVLFAFASLAVDLGIAYTARTSAQHAADAAALAGAYSFVSQPFSTDPQATAANAAIAVAAQNSVLGKAVTGPFAVQGAPCPAGGTTNLVCVDTANRRVTVNVARTAAAGSPIAMYFARVIGWNNLDVATVATAEAAKQAAGTTCVKPIFIPNTIVATAGQTIKDACDSKHVLFDSGQVSAYAPTQYNTTMLFRPLNPGTADVPSQYYTVDFGSGANTVRCTIDHCLNDPACSVDPALVQNFTLKCGSSISTENGVQTGPVVQGFNNLIAGDTYDPKTGLINSAGGGVTDTSAQMVLAPVWDDCVPPYQMKSGKQQFQVVGFAKMFVNPGGVKPQGDITAYLVQAVTCAGAQGSNATGPFAVPVRLIQQAN